MGATEVTWRLTSSSRSSKLSRGSSPTSTTTSWKTQSLTPSQTSPLVMQIPKSWMRLPPLPKSQLWRSSLMLRPLALPLVNVPEKSRRSNLLQRISQKLVYSVARRELQSLSCFPMISRKSCALSFRFTTKNAPSRIKLAISSTLESGTRSLPLIKQRSSSTAMRLKGKKCGWMLRLLQSIRSRSLKSLLTS